MLSRCDAIALVQGWARSAGTITELLCAEELGIPVHMRYPSPGHLQDAAWFISLPGEMDAFHGLIGTPTQALETLRERARRAIAELGVSR